MKRRIRWKLHLRSAPTRVFECLGTPAGRARFWAESAEETNGMIHFRFINGWTYDSRILTNAPPRHFEIEYFESVVQFELSDDGAGGTDLTMTNTGVSEASYDEVHAGWLSVLLALKAAVDFGVDLRNHDPSRTWDQGFVDN